MQQPSMPNPPRRITDLVAHCQKGAAVTCRPTFDVFPVDFSHRRHRFRAHVFICRYQGSIDGRPYEFRKCYARGCPHNLCPHVSQAVMIANRYLQRDYSRLETAGIHVRRHLFSLQDMTVKFENREEREGKETAAGALFDVIDLAREGAAPVSVTVALEEVPAVEHFAGQKTAQTFLMGDFTAEAGGRRLTCQRCLACYPTENPGAERNAGLRTANERLRLLYRSFNENGIRCQEPFFE